MIWLVANNLILYLGNYLFYCGDMLVASWVGHHLETVIGVAFALLAPLSAVNNSIGLVYAKVRNMMSHRMLHLEFDFISIVVAAIFSIVLIGMQCIMAESLGVLQLDAEIEGSIKRFLIMTSPSILPFNLYVIARQILVTEKRAKVVNFLLLVFVILNVGLSYTLIFHFSVAHTNALSSLIIATNLTRSLLGFFAIIYFWRARRPKISFNQLNACLKLYLKIATPLMVALFVNIGFYSLAALFANKLDLFQADAFFILMNVSSILYLVNLAIADSTLIFWAVQDVRVSIRTFARRIAFYTIVAQLALLLLLESSWPIIVQFYSSQAAIIVILIQATHLLCFFKIIEAVETALIAFLRSADLTSEISKGLFLTNWVIGIPLFLLLETYTTLNFSILLGAMCFVIALSCLFFVHTALKNLDFKEGSIGNFDAAN